MAPKKSKGSSSCATPIPDEAKARAVYKQHAEKKKWLEPFQKGQVQTSDFVHCLAFTRVLLDKKPDKGKGEKVDAKDWAAILKAALDLYTKLPAGCEQPPKEQLTSLGMLVARAQLLQLLANEQQLKPEQLLDGLDQLSQQISKGFTRDGWHKVWYDPKSDNLKEEDKARSNMVVVAGAAAEQLLEAYTCYVKIMLGHVLKSDDPVIKAAEDKIPSVGDLRGTWHAEATAAKVRQHEFIQLIWLSYLQESQMQAGRGTAWKGYK
jgi:hypothetical protein